MKRIYYLQRIILSVLLLLPLSGCFDSDINRKMYEADDDEMQRENHIVGATLRVMQGLVSRRASICTSLWMLWRAVPTEAIWKVS